MCLFIGTYKVDSPTTSNNLRGEDDQGFQAISDGEIIMIIDSRGIID